MREWLERPRVKLVVVEFYATWCKPCMAAIPRWRKLHEKYRDQGLRLIVVNTRDPDAGCRALPWNPDKTLCDYDGVTAQRFGVGGKLPSAFLWSWQGNLLVRSGHVDQVEKQVLAYLDTVPRVVVEATRGGEPALGLQQQVVDELGRLGKFNVLATAAERARLKRLRKETHRADRRDDQRCELGKELSPNSVLLAKRYRAGKAGERLSLSLQSIETGCVTQTVSVPFGKRDPAGTVSEAVSALVSKLRRAPELPRVKPTARGDQRLGGGDAWEPGQSQTVVIRFESVPAGAKVTIDGVRACKATPCQTEVSAGDHTVAMSLGDHKERSERVTVNGGVVRWELKPTFATATVTSPTSGLDILVDGQRVGQTPLGPLRLKPGRHKAVVSGPCHLPEGLAFDIEVGEHRDLHLTPLVRPSAIDVSARNADGDAVVADVKVDGVKVGKTPGVFKVGVCAARVTVHDQRETWTAALQLKEQRTTRLVANLGRRSAPATAPPQAPIADARRSDSAVSVPDPRGDDTGPGTFVYPTDKAYKPGSFDITGLRVTTDGAMLHIRVEYAVELLDPWDSKAWDGNGFSLQYAQVYVDTTPGHGYRRPLPGVGALQFGAGQAWDRVILLSPQGSKRLQSEVAAKAQDMKQAVVIPTRVWAKGRTLHAQVPLASLSGDSSRWTSWGWQVLSLANEGYPRRGSLLVREVNEHRGAHRFGGGDDLHCDHNVLDALGGPESLRYKCPSEPANVPMVHP